MIFATCRPPGLLLSVSPHVGGSWMLLLPLGSSVKILWFHLFYESRQVFLSFVRQWCVKGMVWLWGQVKRTFLNYRTASHSVMSPILALNITSIISMGTFFRAVLVWICTGHIAERHPKTKQNFNSINPQMMHLCVVFLVIHSHNKGTLLMPEPTPCSHA